MEKDENSKQKILSVATKLFAHKGFDAVSVREICKEANANLCLISYHFGGKQELYNAIIDDLIEKQTRYANTFLDFSVNPRTLKKQEQIELLYKVLDKFIDFFYSKITNDLILLLLKEQQNPDCRIKTPAFEYLKKLIGAIFNLEENSRELVYQTLFIISQLNSPRIFPAFSLRQLGQDTFNEQDIKIIRDNIKFYINLTLKEKGIV